MDIGAVKVGVDRGLIRLVIDGDSGLPNTDRYFFIELSVALVHNIPCTTL